MTFTAIVMYPNPPDLVFDLDYYLKTHMPLVEKNWGPFGLKKWEIVQYAPGLNDEKPEFCIAAHLTWESEDAVRKAGAAPAAANVFADVPKFTNQKPVFMIGGIVGCS